MKNQENNLKISSKLETSLVGYKKLKELMLLNFKMRLDCTPTDEAYADKTALLTKLKSNLIINILLGILLFVSLSSLVATLLGKFLYSIFDGLYLSNNAILIVNIIVNLLCVVISYFIVSGKAKYDNRNQLILDLSVNKPLVIGIFSVGAFVLLSLVSNFNPLGYFYWFVTNWYNWIAVLLLAFLLYNRSAKQKVKLEKEISQIHTQLQENMEIISKGLSSVKGFLADIKLYEYFDPERAEKISKMSSEEQLAASLDSENKDLVNGYLSLELFNRYYGCFEPALSIISKNAREIQQIRSRFEQEIDRNIREIELMIDYLKQGKAETIEQAQALAAQ